ncbi:MAG: acetoacetate decarboxylase family protein [Candidatus Hodarchaeota archaeon]
MVEYERPTDYSMPRQCGIFPPPPIMYRNTRVIAIVFQCAPGVKKKCLPPELESIENGLDIISFFKYPESSIGPYNELVIALNCIYKGKPGLFIYNIYVDDDVALTAGREIWGFPKKMCEINLTPIEDNKVRGFSTRKGITFLDVEAEIMNNPPGLDTKGMFESMAIYNLKIIPDVKDNSKPALRQLTETYFKIEVVYKNLAAKINYIKSEYSEYDICHEILKDADTNLGAIYLEGDLILPNGHVLG